MPVCRDPRVGEHTSMLDIIITLRSVIDYVRDVLHHTYPKILKPGTAAGSAQHYLLSGTHMCVPVYLLC